MLTHTFAICAYQDSPYLEACIRSLKNQSVGTKIILCTSTPSPYIEQLTERYGLPYYVREGKSDIQADWNFACEKADSRLVTIAHQDDIYHKDYAKYMQRCWEKYPDTTVFTTDCAIIKNGKIQKPGMIALVKHILRLPLRLHRAADRELVKKAALCFGNPIICPSCTYDKETLGLPLFDSPYKFALDWDTMWKLAARPGRFYCEELPLIHYRVHAGSETKKCIEDNRRSKDEIAMFRKIWPEPVVRVLMLFYKKAYGAYNQER
jgi:hypothetical protein